MTEDAGVEYQLNSRVESLIIEDGFVKGAVVKQNGRSEQRFLAKIVVDAEGISSRILTRTGMAGLNRLKLVNGVEAEVENVKDVKMDMVEVFLGKNYAPRFYAWLIPQDDGKAKVGLATNTGNPKEFLQRLMLKHPVASKKLCNSKILKINYHPITLGGLIPKIYSNGFLAVGDVASQVKPTTGGGVIFGLTCAKVAAEVVVEALRENDFSADFLGAYQKRCEEILGFDLKVMLRVRRILDALSDEKIEQAIGICAKLNLGKPIQNIEEIDFQGRSFLHLLRSPRMIVALTYLFFLFLSPNC
jgi:digeranylgeranylglycerophospholipid reductase